MYLHFVYVYAISAPLASLNFKRAYVHFGPESLLSLSLSLPPFPLCLLLFGCTLHICSKIFFDAFSVVLLKSFNLPTHLLPLSRSHSAFCSTISSQNSNNLLVSILVPPSFCLSLSLSFCAAALSINLLATSKAPEMSEALHWQNFTTYIVDKSCDCY